MTVGKQKMHVNDRESVMGSVDSAEIEVGATFELTQVFQGEQGDA